MVLIGADRVKHIAEQKKKADYLLRELRIGLSSDLSFYETANLMIQTIEDQMRCDSAKIRKRAEEVTRKWGGET